MLLIVASVYVAVTQPCINCGMSASGELCRICTGNPECDDVTVAFRRICSKVTATYAGRVDGSIPTTCGALPSVIWFEKLYGPDSRGTSTSQSLLGTTHHTVDIVAAYDDTVRTHT